MFYSAADYNSNERDKVVINPVYIEKKTDNLKKIRNKTSKNVFFDSYGIYIVMAALLTALIAFNIALYKRVSELSVMTPSENKTDTPAEKILNSENVLLREEIKENLKSLEKKIETSVHGIERKLDGSLQNFKLETKNELVGNHESTNREISKSVNQIRNEMISKMTNFDIAPLLKKFDHLFLYSLHFGIQNNVHISHFAGFFYAYKKP
jgi:hypothetical protein